jgi:hypothetical protein
MAFNMYGKSKLGHLISLLCFVFREDIDKNGRVDAKEMEQIVTVSISMEDRLFIFCNNEFNLGYL